VRDKKLSDYGLPDPEEYETELQRALLEYDPQQQQQTQLLQHLNGTTAPNTEEQQNIFNLIMDSIHNRRTSLYFIQGMGGGSGKTDSILAASRSTEDILCLGCASTGLAATNYENFDTAHGLFKFPVTEDGDDNDEDEKCVSTMHYISGSADSTVILLLEVLLHLR
jgi:hypothetical protein